MHLNISAKYLIAFLALCFLMFETHEFAHILTGRIICGAWGFRDFKRAAAQMPQLAPADQEFHAAEPVEFHRDARP